MTTPPNDSVSDLIRNLKEGGQDAAEELWKRYNERLVETCRKRLTADLRRMADEEDIALSAFKSLCLGAARGRFDQLTDRHDLWHLLLTISKRKVVDHIRRERAAKRGGGEVPTRPVGEGDGSEAAFDELVADSATPELLAVMAEESERLLKLLRNDTLRQIALWRVEGRSNGEIAEELGVTERTVERKLRLIREKWSEEA